MIQTRVEYSGQRLQAAERDAATFTVISFALFRQSYNKTRPALLRALTFTPNRRYWTKDDFASDASRRAFFAKTGGKAYTRTGRYAKSWQVNLVQTDDGGAVTARNDAEYAKFVGGSFSRSKNWQQKGHIRTGWPNAADAAEIYFNELLKDFGERMRKYARNDFANVSVSTRNR